MYCYHSDVGFRVYSLSVLLGFWNTGFREIHLSILGCPINEKGTLFLFRGLGARRNRAELYGTQALVVFSIDIAHDQFTGTDVMKKGPMLCLFLPYG